MTPPTSRDVFAMRKQGCLDEALAAARELCRAPAPGPYDVRALGWCLVDTAWQAIRRRNFSAARQLHDELRALPVQPDDTPLVAARTRLSRALEDDARIRPILDRLTELARTVSDDSAAARPEVIELLRRYATLPDVSRPGLLHSRILACAVRLHREIPTFTSFVVWWDPANLRPQDWQRPAPRPATSSNASAPSRASPPLSLAERLIAALAHCRTHDDFTPERVAKLRPLFDAALQRHPDNPWLPYQIGTMLARVGEIDAARPLLLRFCRAHARESWSWAALAETYPDDPATAAALLARAVTLPASSPDQRLPLRERLAMLAHTLGRPDIARHIAEALIAERTSRQYRCSDSLRALAGLAAPPADSETVRSWISELAARADEILHPLDTLAVVVRHDLAHRLTALAIGPCRTALAYYETWPEVAKLSPGRTVRVALRPPRSPDRPPVVHRGRPADEPLPRSFAREFRGRLTQKPGGFAFVGTIFVPPPLAALAPVSGEVRGIAILEKHRSRPGQSSWNAISLAPAATGEPSSAGDPPCPA